MCQLCHACKGIKVLVQWTCGLVQCAMRTGGEVQNCKEVKHILSRRSRYPPTFISQSPTHHGCQSCKRYVWTIMDHDNYGPSTTYDSSKLDNPDMMRCRKLWIINGIAVLMTIGLAAVAINPCHCLPPLRSFYPPWQQAVCSGYTFAKNRAELSREGGGHWIRNNL